MTPKPHKTLYRYDVKTIDGEDFVDAEAHSELMARYNDLVEQLEALRWSAQYVADMHPEGESEVDHKSMRRLRAALTSNPAKRPDDA